MIDIFCGGFLLLLTSPVLLITAAAIRLTDPGPVLYRQTRAGLRNRPFQLFKFRSMRVNNLPLYDTTQASEIRGDHPLVTPVGRWIRRLKVDELPQMLNVLRGEMSLIGPRPTVPEQTEEYTAFEMRRLEILPGLTGWTQINGGTENTWPERIMLDVWYVDHRSLWLDLSILWHTAAVVLFGERPNPKALADAKSYAEQQILQTGTASPRRC
jgi:lipopolysaccharide/colanic/teichoic acid biosynthesis glycosyltransferase